MSDSIKGGRTNGRYLLQRAKSAAPAFQEKLNELKAQTKLQRRPTVVLVVDQNCPTHGNQGDCTCTPVVPNGSNLGSNTKLNLTNIEPFTNHPPLLRTQRDIVGNNLHFNSLSQIDGWNGLNNEQIASLMLYRDALKHNLTTPYSAHGSMPRMRVGRAGGYWRHIQQTNSHSGSNLLYVNGTVRKDDSAKYPIPRFGYPPMTRPQHIFLSSSNQEASDVSLNNPSTQSLDSMSWSSPTEALKRRPSLSQYANRYQRHAKEGFAYWPTDIQYNKPRSSAKSTGTYKTWLGLSDSILKL